MSREDNHDRELDIVLVILDLVAVAAPGLTPDKVRAIEQSVREKYGGVRARIAKRGKHPTPEQREKVASEALAESNAAVPTDRIAEANGIHRSTLYRYLKRRGA